MKSKIFKTYQGPKYPSEAQGKLPAFNSYEEEANFWDTHNFVDLEPLNVYKPKTESLILRIQKDLKKKLIKVAKQKGVTVSTLSRIWLTEKLQSA